MRTRAIRHFFMTISVYVTMQLLKGGNVGTVIAIRGSGAGEAPGPPDTVQLLCTEVPK